MKWSSYPVLKNRHKIFHTDLAEQSFAIECNNEDAYALAAFLFTDFPGSRLSHSPIEYDIISAGKQPMLSLWQGEKRLFFGSSRYQVAYVLMNDVIYHCINNNSRKHALHAGAVFKNGQCILLPGASGNGKSTLTAWLISNGYQYLTDELVFLSDDGSLSPLTRPVNLKVSGDQISWLLKKGDEQQILSDEHGSMIPHRLLNRQFTATTPRVTHLLFPQYQREAECRLEEISPARSSLYLMQSHVNARNLSGHGVPAIASIVRECRSYKLVYGSFDDLETIFNSSSGPFSQ